MSAPTACMHFRKPTWRNRSKCFVAQNKNNQNLPPQTFACNKTFPINRTKCIQLNFYLLKVTRIFLCISFLSSKINPPIFCSVLFLHYTSICHTRLITPFRCVIFYERGCYQKFTQVIKMFSTKRRLFIRFNDLFAQVRIKIICSFRNYWENVQRYQLLRDPFQKDLALNQKIDEISFLF